jgi:hypothetical protein
VQRGESDEVVFVESIEMEEGVADLLRTMSI